eukprot:TRINITY_DN5102_c0_g1_i1.p1 TRINITY_DN5102_c0_g1~~TRINITY_DN5102_c0_g1_i1.p1  ORF type:complete len:267 (-),score=36.16 TRINITY_DN5102_c0_g1_i1:194-994(-)
MRARKRTLQATPMPREGRAILDKLERNPSLKELEMLQEHKWFRIILDREGLGESMEDIVEDVANTNTDEKIRREAFLTCTSTGCRVQLQSLSPTQRPTGHSVTETMHRGGQSNVFAVGLSPTIAWFGDGSTEPGTPRPPSGTSVDDVIGAGAVASGMAALLSGSPLADRDLHHPLQSGVAVPGISEPRLGHLDDTRSLKTENLEPTAEWDPVMGAIEDRPPPRRIRWALPSVVPSAPTTPRTQRSDYPDASPLFCLRRWIFFCCCC